MNMLVTVDPSNVHYIMNSNFLNFPKGPHHPQFHRLFVKTAQDKVEKGLIKVLEHVSKQGLVVDLQDLFQRLTFDTTCILVTGYDPGCLSIDLPYVPFTKAMDDVTEAIFIRHVVPESVWKFQRWVSIGHEKKLRNARKTLDHIIEKYISMKRDELSRVVKSNDEEEEGNDLLTLYLNEEEIKNDYKFLRDTVLNFMIAGRDMSSSALTWFLWLVSTHSDIEEKIREELKSNIPAKEANKWRLFRIEEMNKVLGLPENNDNSPRNPPWIQCCIQFRSSNQAGTSSRSGHYYTCCTELVLNHPRFHRFLVKTTQDKVEKGLIKVLEHVSKQGLVVDLQDLFQRLTFDTTCILVTSYNPGCLSIDLPHVPFTKAMDDVTEAIFIRHVVPESVWKFQRWVSIGHEKKLRNARKTLDHIIEKYISMKRDELSRVVKSNDEEEEGNDLLTLYLNEEEIKNDYKFLRDTILNFMIARRDTSSSALTWFLWLVSTHSDIEEKIREELKSNIPTKEANKWRLFRIEEETNKKNGVPATCLEVWMAGYSKDSKPSTDKVAEVIELGMQSNATDEEIITQVDARVYRGMDGILLAGLYFG
ncbi:hypothetical protein TEA_029573 [Camellia sinensis var. sinensis]|uniref:Cytochrome P450 n=1 Tax=Camellia sinensis var. sinensis TaxID=542762 RepID=A0A4S4DAD4_CAMSN|nr:hypothetical protein TEA_029573 [Camellia sinensis var. sinensis]